MPYCASNTPLSMGPSMRERLLVAISTDMARPMRSGPTTSPTIERRTGLSAAQQMPLRKLATARCQTLMASRLASTTNTSAHDKETVTITISALRRSKRSAATPRNAPNKPIGNSRSMLNRATIKAELVIS